MPSTLTFKRDYATTDDQLGFSRYVDTIGEMISDENFETPFCIGVHGKWGSGKTSFMRQLQTFLEKNPTDNPITIPVWFNPWRYTNEDHLIIPFLKTIEAELKRYSEILEANSKTVKRNIVNRACLAIARTARSIAYASQLNFGVVKFTGKDAVNQEKDLLAAEKDQDFTEEHQELAEIYFTVTQHLQQVVFAETDEIATADKKTPALRLVIFIDDLDRCLPEKAVELLEAMKLFLDLEGYLFVLGVDRNVVEEGIRNHYKFDVREPASGNQPEQGLAEKYLEKMIQMPLELPPVEPTRKRQLIDKLLEKSVGFSEHGQLIHDGIAGRPRDIVRFTNYLAFFGRLAEKIRSDIETGESKNGNKPGDFKELLDVYFSPEFYLKWAILVHAFRYHHREILKRTDYFFRMQRQARPDLKEDKEQLGGSEGPISMDDRLRKVLSYGNPIPEEPWLIRTFVHLADSVTQTIDAKGEITALTPAIRGTVDVKLPEIGSLVHIPKGPFLFGEDKKQQNIEQAYVIDKYPVTNQQFFLFLTEEFAAGAGVLDGEGKPIIDFNRSRIERNEDAENPLFKIKDGYDKHPVTGVSWYGARAFCEWRTVKEGQRKQGKLEFRLPTEEEWEKAARGDGGYEYPWGNEFDSEKCNTNESGIKNTTLVDAYPDGKSPYDCFDMAGNVWEWTESIYGKDSESMVLKGGSWFNGGAAACCAGGYWDSPYGRGSFVGFRCAGTIIE